MGDPAEAIIVQQEWDYPNGDITHAVKGVFYRGNRYALQAACNGPQPDASAPDHAWSMTAPDFDVNGDAHSMDEAMKAADRFMEAYIAGLESWTPPVPDEPVEDIPQLILEGIQQRLGGYKVSGIAMVAAELSGRRRLGFMTTGKQRMVVEYDLDAWKGWPTVSTQLSQRLEFPEVFLSKPLRPPKGRPPGRRMMGRSAYHQRLGDDFNFTVERTDHGEGGLGSGPPV